MDGLILLGVILFAVGLIGFRVGRHKSGRGSVIAKNHSIAVGGDVKGDVINSNKSSGGNPPSWERALAIISAILGIIGFGVTLWALLA